MSEGMICRQFVAQLKFLELNPKKPFVWFHVANEGKNVKNPIFGANLKRAGKKNGAPDYVFLWENGGGFIEFKTFKGKLSKDQKEFEAECILKNIPYCIARSTDEGINILKEWGIL